MAKRPSAGAMREKMHFQRRAVLDDGMGNTTSGPWETVFTEAAELVPLKGGETVIAARLGGVQPFIVRVHGSIRTRAVGADWQLVDARNPARVFAITAPPTNPDQKNAWIDIMVTQGVAS